MRITRKIPGIRLPIPGRKDEAAPGLELFSPGWTTALVYTLLLAVLAIYLLCTLRFGGELSYFWLETEVLGLSLYTIASGINILLIVYAITAFVAARRKGSHRDWKKMVGFLFALTLLGCTQLFLNGWKNLARWDRESSLVKLEEELEAVAAFRIKLEGLGEHAWGGEYVARTDNVEKRWLLAPDNSACQVLQLDRYSDDGPLHERSGGFASFSSEVVIEEGRLLLDPPGWPPPERYAVVTWGERRYLVEADAVDEFLARADGPPTEGAVFLRVGDEARPLEGRPSVVEDLP